MISPLGRHWGLLVATSKDYDIQWPYVLEATVMSKLEDASKLVSFLNSSGRGMHNMFKMLTGAGSYDLKIRNCFNREDLVVFLRKVKAMRERGQMVAM